jgi:hypothetical protein
VYEDVYGYVYGYEDEYGYGYGCEHWFEPSWRTARPPSKLTETTLRI